MFRSFFTMHRNCPVCDLLYEREQGYFVGAIYINYAVTVLIALPGYFVLDIWAGPSLPWQLVFWSAFATFFPLLFFRHSRSFWLCLEYFFNPAERLRVVKKTESRRSAGR